MKKLPVAACLAGLALMEVATGACAQGPDQSMTRDQMLSVLKQQFSAMDSNKDGVVTQPEFDAYLAKEPASDDGEGGSILARLSHVGHHWFERADRNGDGRVTFDEAAARPLQYFQMADANHDGVVSPGEQKTALAMMQSFHRH